MSNCTKISALPRGAKYQPDSHLNKCAKNSGHYLRGLPVQLQGDCISRAVVVVGRFQHRSPSNCTRIIIMDRHLVPVVDRRNTPGSWEASSGFPGPRNGPAGIVSSESPKSSAGVAFPPVGHLSDPANVHPVPSGRIASSVKPPARVLHRQIERVGADNVVRFGQR